MGDVNGPGLLDRCEQIDALWLTEVLRASGIEDAPVADFAIRPIGAGNVSDTVRVKIQYPAGSSGPSSLVCKFRCSDEIAHAHGVGSGSYLREVESYRALLRRPDVCRIPYVYHVDGDTENINLVMEDLSATTRAGDQVAGCGLSGASSVVEELAKLHRAFHPMGRYDAPGWGMTMTDSADYWVQAIERGLSVVRDQVAERLSGREMDTVVEAARAASAWYNLPMIRGTLTHGDPRVDNILFGEAGAIVIDWQVTGWRNPMHDVGYFLSGSVSVESRRLSEYELLKLYADTFGPGYNQREIERDYQVQLLSGLMTTIAAYGLLTLSPHVSQLLLTLLQRNVAAAADWDSIASIARL